MVRSALIGSPPLNGTDDYWVVRNFLLVMGLVDKVPISAGAAIPPPKPADYHFETTGPSIIAGSAVSLAVILLITLPRLYFRWSGVGLRWGLDDWFIIPGLLLAITTPILNIVGVVGGGYGKHIYDTTYYEFYIFEWIQGLSKIVFFVGVGMVKISITLFNMRLTSFTSPTWTLVHRIFLGLVVGYTVAALFSTIFACNPLAGGFDVIASGKLDHRAKCVSYGSLTSALSVIHVVMDLCLLATPLIVLMRTQMKTKAKLRLCILFSVGSVSVIGSVLRQIAQKRLDGLAGDPIYNQTPVLAWTLVDLTFGIAAASLPMLSTMLPRALRDSSRKAGNGSSGYLSRPNGSTYVSTTIGGGKSRRSLFHGSQRLASRDRSGIMVQDEIELRYHAAHPGQSAGRTNATDEESVEESIRDKKNVEVSGFYLPEGQEENHDLERGRDRTK